MPLRPGDLCDCGNTAVLIKGNAKLCERCNRIEREMYCCKGGRHSRVVQNLHDVRKRFTSAVETYQCHAVMP
jgi:hypothetical protein